MPTESEPPPPSNIEAIAASVSASARELPPDCRSSRISSDSSSPCLSICEMLFGEWLVPVPLMVRQVLLGRMATAVSHMKVHFCLPCLFYWGMVPVKVRPISLHSILTLMKRKKRTNLERALVLLYYLPR